jgi:hypothetical protein
LSALCIDIAATTGRRAALIAGVAGGTLLVVSRQTYFSWLPMLLVLWLERSRTAGEDGPRISPQMRRTGIIALAAIPALTAVLMVMRDSSNAQIILIATLLLLRNPAEAWSCLVVHPVFDTQRLSICIPPLTIIGAVWILRHSPARFSWALGAAGSMFISIASNWPSAGNRWGFRVPIYVLAVIAAGIGASWLEESISRMLTPQRRRWCVGMLGATIAFSGLLAPVWRENRIPQAEFQNYVFLRDTLERLHKTESLGLVLPPQGSEGPRNAASALANLMNIRRETADAALNGTLEPNIHWYFYRELACATFSVFELQLGPNVQEKVVERWLEEDEDRLVTALFRPQRRFGLDDAVKTDWVERPTCIALTSKSESIGLLGPRLVPIQDPPQSVVMVPSVTPELRRITLVPRTTPP